MKYTTLIALFCLLFNKGFSQCCSPGNPVGGDANQGVLNKNTLRIMGVVKKSVSNDYYEGSHKARDSYSFVDRGSFNFSGITLAYGLLKVFTVESELGYFISKKQEYNTPSGKQELIGYGLSDLAFLGKFRLLSSPAHQFELTTGAGYKIPVGPHQQRNEYGVLLPIDIQPATGAYGYIATFFLYKGFVEKNIRMFLTGRAQLNPKDVVFSEIIPTKYYRYGNFFTSSLFLSYNLSHRWTTILQTRYEFRTQDIYKDSKNPQYRVYSSSGGKKIMIVPQIVFEVQQGLNVSALIDIPAYQYYNQKQLATAYAGTLTITKSFGMCKPAKTMINDGEGKN